MKVTGCKTGRFVAKQPPLEPLDTMMRSMVSDYADPPKPVLKPLSREELREVSIAVMTSMALVEVGYMSDEGVGK